ncbi:hypothetical protein [Thermococcus sp. 21S7]|uniref:DUF7662 domain-containing protein n=1 Tax=Thermococcus sp. 21S7 TaxID=1638221 RepID=UPI00143B81C8|nr:hypothetical protein [Thermococcus sp. 21S7]
MENIRESKYGVLKAWLQLQTDKDRIEISPAELENKLKTLDEKFSLPKSAYKYAAWWANENSEKKWHVQARKGWLAAGWKAYPEVRNRKVVKVIFRRG